MRLLECLSQVFLFSQVHAIMIAFCKGVDDYLAGDFAGIVAAQAVGHDQQ